MATMDKVNRVRTFLTEGVWEVRPETSTPTIFFTAKIVRWVLAIAREFRQGGLTFRATSLVYTTLLSFVPLLAVSFSVLKAFGVRNQIEPFLHRMLEPLGDEGRRLAETVVGFVQNMEVGVLGGVGVAVLFYTVVSLLEKIEEAFNHIWKTQQSRSLARRFSDYLSIILVGPVLIFSALAMTVSMADTALVQKIISVEPFGAVFYFLGLLVPYLLFTAAFTFMYLFIPNTRVQFTSALLGGTLAGIFWKLVGWGFSVFVAGSTKYNAIYSSFAILILFIIWIDLNWLIVLLGVQVAFFHQNPEYIGLRSGEPRLSCRRLERAGLVVMYLIANHYYRDGRPWTLRALVGRLGLPMESVRDILDILARRHFILAVGEGEQAYVPGHALEKIALKDVLDCLRSAPEESLKLDDRTLSEPAIDELLQGLGAAYEPVLGDKTLRDVLEQSADS